MNVRARLTAPRSPKWRALRRHHLAAHPTCAACGRTRSLQVHHIRPVHLWPDLELDPDNLITLCEGVLRGRCHLHIGHLGHWYRWNPDVAADAAHALASAR